MFVETARNKLTRRKQEGIYRTLPRVQTGIDFTSNDYLGYARNIQSRDVFSEQTISLGSTGSRLLTGNSVFAEKLEKELSEFFQAESALLFGSGYCLNTGLMATLAQKEDVVLMDMNVHSSIKSGAVLSGAKRFFFRHNDLSHLEKRLSLSKGNIFVIVESLYSMDGDMAPLEEMVILCEKYKAHLVVDEAHATGVLGPKGRGMVCRWGLEKKILARVITFGKAMGVHGAALLGSQWLKEYFINYCHSFIYTTALPPFSLAAIRRSMKLLKRGKGREKLEDNIAFFNKEMNIVSHPAPIYSFPMERTLLKKTANLLQSKGLMVFPILTPTVKKDRERLRVSLHAFNTEKEISQLAGILREVL